MKDLAYLNKYLWKYRLYLIAGIAFTAVSNVFSIIPAVFVRYSFNLLENSYELFELFEGFRLQSKTVEIFGVGLLIAGITILVSTLLRGGFMFLMRQTVIVMSRHVEYDLKNEIYQHYQNLPLSFYRRNNTGDLMNRISEDVSRVRMYIGPAIMYTVNLVTLFFMVIPYMFSINFELTLYSLLPLPILSVSIYFVNNIINKRSEEIQESLSDLSTFVQEAFSGIRVIKSFVREPDYLKSFSSASEDYRKKSLKLAFVQSLFLPLIMGLIGLSVILTVYMGGVQVMQGKVTTGNIAEFIIYVNMLTWPVASLGWVTSIIQRAAASQRRVNEFLLTKNDILPGKNLNPVLKGEIKFDQVSFRYPDTGILALDNISFEVGAGKSVAIIGTTGSGKSTIANLLLRLYDVTDGQVILDREHEIKDLDLTHYRSQCGYVPQDVFLFSDTIENNIAFGSDDISLKEVKQAAQDADLMDNIEGFEKGFQTKIGERGITLSGGQKQRTSIARAIVRSPKILILDDALSAVDTKTENTILNSMKKIMRDRTTVIISHRVSSAKLADQVIVLDQGKIVEKGSHDQLIAREGVYKDLYHKQIKGEKQSVEVI